MIDQKLCETCAYNLECNRVFCPKEMKNPEPEVEPTGGLYGWICPKCGAVMSPFQSYCIKCSGNWEITYSTDSAPAIGFYKTAANFNERQRGINND